MSEHHAIIRWHHTSGEFTRGTYSRAHSWKFDGGQTVPASPSPAVVREPLSDPSAVDPEEAFVAALASCHMLTFLHLASKAGFDVQSYEDDAFGTMAKNERRIPWVNRVTLRPRIVYAPDKSPTPEQEAELHHRAHEGCFIANSVKTEVHVEPTRAT